MISHSYYIVMIDYGRKGLEAVVDPEITRNGVIERIRSGEYKNIAFIHHVQPDNIWSDVTEDLMSAAGKLMEAAE